MIGNARICLAAALPFVLSTLASCASQTSSAEIVPPQSIGEGEAGCLRTHGPLIKTDIIDQKTVVFWDLEKNIYRVGTRDICLATADIRQTSFLDIVRPRALFSTRERRQICTHKLDRVKAEYFVSLVHPAVLNCLITSVSLITDADYQEMVAAITGGEKKPRSPRRMNWDRGAR
jgi:hypothetical protein